MSLEATLIMLDNSAYALNGDYLPTRWEGQVDAASLLIQAKLEANMQSSVGLGLMGGRQVEILCTMTSDSVKVSSFLFGCKVHGELHFTQVHRHLTLGFAGWSIGSEASIKRNPKTKNGLFYRLDHSIRR